LQLTPMQAQLTAAQDHIREQDDHIREQYGHIRKQDKTNRIIAETIRDAIRICGNVVERAGTTQMLLGFQEHAIEKLGTSRPPNRYLIGVESPPPLQANAQLAETDRCVEFVVADTLEELDEKVRDKGPAARVVPDSRPLPIGNSQAIQSVGQAHRLVAGYASISKGVKRSVGPACFACAQTSALTNRCPRRK